MSLEKNKMLARETVHVPMTLELVCTCYQSDPQFHLVPDHPLSFLYGQLYRWLLLASGAPAKTAPLEKFIQKVAYSSLFKSKFASPTLVPKAINQVPRDFRAAVMATRFFEAASAGGKGARFVHPRITEYLYVRCSFFLCLFM